MRDWRATQVFPGHDVRTTGHRLPAGTEVLAGIPRQSDGEPASFAPGNRTSVRDPWQEQEEAGSSEHAGDPDRQTHDPYEVTVQLDAVQLGDGFLRQAQDGTGAEAPADRPVFVDESGRRSRRYRRIGMAVALACGVYAVVIVATLLSGNSNAPWLPVPTREDNPPAGQEVDSPPLTAESASPGDTADTGVTAPDSTPATGDATAPAPGSSASAPAAGVDPGTRPGASAKPSPTATRTTPKPGTKATDPAPTEPADPPSTPVTDPTPTGEATPQPTETTDTGGDGGTVAEGPAEPQPVAEAPAEPQPAAETPAA